jgi:hypothetical protein
MAIRVLKAKARMTAGPRSSKSLAVGNNSRNRKQKLDKQCSG